MSKELPYIRFLELLAHLEQQFPDAHTLDDTEKTLLNYIALSNRRGRQIRIGELIALGRIASSATLHGRLKNLKNNGYIEIHANEGDGRSKTVTLAKAATKYYKSLSVCLKEAVS